MAMLADADFSNTTIRRFDILRLLARGGMGEVYVARDAVLGRDLALKILRQDVTWDANRLERFVHEARAASALNHPHVVSIYDIGESAPKRNGVARRFAGALHRDGARGREDTQEGDRTPGVWISHGRSNTWLQVADALSAAHAAGVIHRDLKPENLMIADGGYAKVLDFGVAKLRADMPGMAESEAADVGRRRRASARSATCRPSRCTARRSIRGPTSSHSGACCTKS